MTTIVSIDELNTATEMPRQMEAPEAAPKDKQAFDEAVSRFRTALGGEGLKLDGEGLKLDAESLGLDEAATGKMPVAPEAEDATVTPDQPEAQVVLQAAPMMTMPLDSTAVQQQVSDTLKVTSVESAAAVRSQMLVAAVDEVCEAIQVSPGVQPGQGEVRIQLKADVLSGTEVFLEAKGTTITVAFNPATADVAEILSRNITQFEQHLAGRVHNYQISARVKRLKG